MIKKLISESGHTLKDLERAIKDLDGRRGSGAGASDTELSRWQQGHDVPTREQLSNLCAVLKVPEGQFEELRRLRTLAERTLNAERASRPKPPSPDASPSSATPPRQDRLSPEEALSGPTAAGHADSELGAAPEAGGRSIPPDRQPAGLRPSPNLPGSPARRQDSARPGPFRLWGVVLATVAVAVAGIATGVLIGKARPTPKSPPREHLCRYQVVADRDQTVAVLRTPDLNADLVTSKKDGQTVTGPCGVIVTNGSYTWTKVDLGKGGAAWMDSAHLTEPTES